MKAVVLAALLVPLGAAQAQGWLGRHLPHTVLSAQYAGSIGLGAVGWHRRTADERLDLGLLYGYLPERLGGTVHTATFAVGWLPWQLGLGDRLRWVPVRAGAFVVLALGPGLHVTRPPQFERGYYWWTENFRQHLHLGTELRLRLDRGPFAHAGLWLQANTNDLYLYSWWPNRTAIPFGDIVQLGLGVDLCLR